MYRAAPGFQALIIISGKFTAQSAIFTFKFSRLILQPLHNETLLLKQIAESHEPAFRQLYDGYSAGIYMVALQHLKLPHLAEDIVQTVFLKLWENRTELGTVQHFASWFYTLSRNTIISSLRKQGSHDTYISYLKERMEIAMDSPELSLLKKEQLNLLQQAVTQLSQQQRTAFLLQREEGLSYEEIGRKMGIATNTVRVHLHKAMESIRNYMTTHSSNDVMVACMISLILLDPKLF